MTRFMTLIMAAAAMLFAGFAVADKMPIPQGNVILTISGNILSANHDETAQFDRTMLKSLDWREVETFTSFTDGPQIFAGPTLASVLDAAKAQGGMLQAKAINDYSVDIPASHVLQHGVILAMDHNGSPMRVRDKGPIWVIYPMSEAEAAKKPFDGEMIWQLNRIEIR